MNTSWDCAPRRPLGADHALFDDRRQERLAKPVAPADVSITGSAGLASSLSTPHSSPTSEGIGPRRSTGPLPEFASPPVVEVALSVAYQPMPRFRLVELARIWERLFRERYPNIEEHPRYDMPIEQPGGPSTLSLSFQLLQTPPLPRLWLTNESGSELVQLQNDMFGSNWRKIEASASYPHYPNLRGPFEKSLAALGAFFEEEGIGSIRPVQCELSYINHIAPDESGRVDLERVLSTLTPLAPGSLLPPPESVRLTTDYLIEADGEVVGRLHTAAEPAIRKSDDTSITVLTLTARGKPIGHGVDGVLAFLDVGHEWIVRAFDDTTTAEMHKLWGKKNGD